LLRQLRNLRQEKTAREQIDIRLSSGVNDDLAVAVALAANELCKQPYTTQPVPFEILNNPLELIPASCPYGLMCQNFPNCYDENICVGFKDNRGV
jgi:hypothetical protein